LDAGARATELPPLTAAGWAVVSGRDAIKKNFNFANFNEVIFFQYF
jgi:4a-hydroxytetrahydrobiopterin dehydratase